MKVLVVSLTYGNRPVDILNGNLIRAGYDYIHEEVCTEGIANALNDGIDLMKHHDVDAVAFLANDIIEPDNWLAAKVYALQAYPNSGIVASTIHAPVDVIKNEMIIGNWLIARDTVENIGYFQESMFPYGPIDLDYCDRCWAAGFNTYYVINCHAHHVGSHATGDEYGYNKEAMVAKHWPQYVEDRKAYHSKTKELKVERNGNA